MKASPGEAHDKNGYPIYPGDLLRTYHFRGVRRKVYYLYHVVVWNRKEKIMEMVPASHLVPSRRKGGGRAWIFKGGILHDSEIIDGVGPGEDCLYFEDRKRMSWQERKRAGLQVGKKRAKRC